MRLFREQDDPNLRIGDRVLITIPGSFGDMITATITKFWDRVDGDGRPIVYVKRDDGNTTYDRFSTKYCTRIT